ncbi:MAG: insulinase family protein [Opitutae bacterium]|nr:insulinase family protein [Opitutae bacterium]
MPSLADPAAKAVLDGLFARPVKRLTLENGLTVLHVADQSTKLISAQVWVKTGSIHEGPFTGAGLSHYLEHMLFKGTEKRAGSTISEEVQAAGGNINAYTTFDRTVYHIDGPSESIDIFMDVLSDICFHSTLPAKEVIKERDVILREIDMGLDDPDRRVSRTAFETAFLTHPYRHPVIGHRKIFEAVTEDDLRRYHQERYTPNNAVLVLAGDVTGERVQDLSEKYFGDVPMRRLETPYIPEEPTQLSRRENHAIGDYNIVRGILAFPIPSLWDQNAPSLDVLANILGSGESSILWQRIREQEKLVHYIDVHCWNPGTSGLFWISYCCLPDKQDKVEERILSTLEATANDGIAPALLAKAVRQSIVAEVNSRKTMSGQAARLGISEVIVGEAEYARTYFKRLENVTPESTAELIRQHLLTGRYTQASLGPASNGPNIRTTTKTNKDSPGFEEIPLANENTLLLQRNESLPKIHCKAVALGGALYEDTGQRGISELLSTLLAKDTKKRAALEVANTVESIGGSFGGFGGNNTFGLSIEVLKSDQAIALEILGDGLLEPTFDINSFETECESQIAELRESEDEIANYGGRCLRKRFFGKHPYSVGTNGIADDLATLCPDDLRNHWQRLLCPGNVVFSVSGDFDRQHIIEQSQAISEKIKGPAFVKADITFTDPAETGGIHEPLDREQAVVFQAYPDMGILHPSRPASIVLGELLNGMSSNLFNEVREKRSMAYYVGANRVTGIDTGMFYLYAGTTPNQMEDVLQQFDIEMNRLSTGKIHEDEISRAKARLKTGKRMQQQTAGNRTLEAALNKLYGLPVNEFLEYDQQIDAVNAKCVQAVLQESIMIAEPLKLTVQKAS